MTLFAVRQQNPLKSARLVLLRSHDFEVVGVDASRIAAKVVDVQEVRYRPLKEHVSGAVRLELRRPSRAGSNLPVAVTINTPGPQPATAGLFRDLG